MFKRILAFLIFLSLSLPAPLFSQEQKKDVLVITVNGVINPASAEYVGNSIKKANEQKREAVVIELDTPGGLDMSMRDIVKNIIASEVPVIVFVSPSGARAASAGVFITLAAHVAAMSPGTNIGSAHPVGVGGKMDKTMVEKVTNDAAAYIKSLAERTGRNSKWAEDAVRKSISATETEALKERIIDIVSKDLNTLLLTIDGRKVKTVMGEKVLKTANANVVREEMSLRHKILNVITDPNVAYMLMLLGFYGLFFELTSPGAIFPGVMGGICLILAFYAFQTLPVNYAGLLLIILAIILFILEIKIISHGVLTIGGVIAMLFGSLMLFESHGPFMKLSLFLILPAVIATALFFTAVVGLAYKAYKRRPITGAEGLVGMEGIANADITKDSGIVLLRGEIWSAYSDETISKGEKIVVESVSGLKVKVRKTTKGE
ncbi:MAG: serine protease [Nitrospirae bacterium CG_4_10_14_3_um_filter_44_29]|nr:nodulation protein NfeD [Nitrospirota bacterium]OIO27445.1 MAG: serine protease [Nitrospirae bacterium CG1_02_44_142]PIP70130.1 MAG: serine protease [Nitrospirae bacterium CG22_combo_CG10-13_8_21_14_all_44_11]PIV42087.1 MAG: serine protease [Nitrospirae bacterium CG02_land_8_20_14_3_00_44_33]PIV67469.1 MAG: serine protease [Nitrospirae bacterium CG01_land_8_20_14_3_00_44_22]PIW89454.1 MAG: serine protease [Nitrospirae bacterium CG_4_8_14_3_um_filter_44_28]PIX89369.1 MAG: serine protease [N